MNIKLNGNDVTLEYTFNSLRYMEDLDITDLAEIGNKPFKIFSTAELLLMGALNSNKNARFTVGQASTYLEEVANDGEIYELVGRLIGLLEESSFFKNLTKEKKAK